MQRLCYAPVVGCMGIKVKLLEAFGLKHYLVYTTHYLCFNVIIVVFGDEESDSEDSIGDVEKLVLRLQTPD